MSHIVKKERGNNIMTYCGRNISRGAAGNALARGRIAPFFYLDPAAENQNFGMTLLSLTNACEACVQSLPSHYNQTWLVKVRQFLNNMKEIHIFQKRTGDSGVMMMCGKVWDASSLFRNEIGYIEVADLVDNIGRPQLCATCSDHPHVQLQLLAITDLGEMCE